MHMSSTFRSTAFGSVMFLCMFCVLLSSKSTSYKGKRRVEAEHFEYSSKTLTSEELWRRMTTRISRIERFCEENREVLRDIYAELLGTEKNWDQISATIVYSRPEFLVDRHHKLGWCKIPKAGSASMVQALTKLLKGDQQSTNSNIWGHSLLAKSMPPPIKEEDLSDVTSFIIVRHPFSRILSAFRDKFHNRSSVVQFSKFKKLYGQKIIARYRKKPQDEAEYQDMPTFGEFLEYVVDTSPLEFNEHWIPYYLSCVPCHIKYQSVLHTETITDDVNHLVELTGLSELRLEHAHRNTMTTNEINALKTDGSASEDNLEKLYYSSIAKDTLDKLYQIYRIDFEMFGYSIHPYDYYVFRD